MSQDHQVKATALLAPVFIAGAILVARYDAGELVLGLKPDFLAGFLVGFGLICLGYLIVSLRAR